MSLLGWKEACEEWEIAKSFMTPEERHYYEKQSGPTKPNPMMRPMKMNDEKFQDALNRQREKIRQSTNQSFWKGYERTVDQSSSMAEELEFFLRDFPSLRLGQIIAAIVPSTKDNNLELFNIYDEELIRRLRIYSDWLSFDGEKVDWITYLSQNMGDTK